MSSTKEQGEDTKGKQAEYTTQSGIPLKAVYTPEDIKDLDYEKDVGMPGSPPYVRGIYSLMYRMQPWMMLQVMGFEDAKRIRERVSKMHEEGQLGYEKFGIIASHINLDLPSGVMGVDPDDPDAEGNVGRCGISAAAAKDWEPVLEGMPLERFHLGVVAKACAPIQYAFRVACAEMMGFPVNKLRGDAGAAVYEPMYEDTAGFPPEACLRLQVDMTKYSIKHTPSLNTGAVLMDRLMERSWGDLPLSIGICWSQAIAFFEECTKRGVDLNAAVENARFFILISIDFFETICGLRAMRRMWVKIVRDRFGVKNPNACRPKLFVQPCGSDFTAKQPINNVVRGTIEALAGALAGVQAMSIDCYDEAIQIPSEAAQIQSIRIQQILQHESGITSVVDPLGGSYFIESLTNEIEKKAWKYVHKIEDMGGFCAAVKNGYIREELDGSAYRFNSKVWRGERIIVGVNKYQEEKERIPIPIGHKYEVSEEDTIERFKRFKAERDDRGVGPALAKIKGACLDDNADIMPELINAAKANATIGEICGVLKEVFGWDVQ